ncbi:unnamed protein product [Clonostachys rhizophaga]|uniref:Cytochrome P450 n=1 Tax=Clonostachys rhizophaga TaxID=160324 RepID=A0A9N9VPR2_9HYPO|nr:unnamed protein product [Clonostachys rhizophaga]
MDNLNLELTAAAGLGFLAHWAYFIHGERDLQAANIARVHLLFAFIIPYIMNSFLKIPIKEAIYESIKIDAAYAAALFSSIITYRLLFSPLRNIPGPLGMKLSKLTHVVDQAYYRNCERLHELQKKYGDVVRTGPNEVTLFGWHAYQMVHGSDSTCGRSAYYDILHPMVSLDTVRDPLIHAHRRKVWDFAFSIRSKLTSIAMENVEPLIYEHTDKLMAQLHRRKGSSLNICQWLEYYTFDAMGKFGLSVDFDNLSGEEHPIMSLYHIAHRRLGPLAAAPWVKHLLMGIPFIERMKYYRMFFKWAHEELDKNIEASIQNEKAFAMAANSKEERADVIGYVIRDAIQNGGVQKNWNFVLGDFILVIVAGSDPVRQVLANILYYLILNPHHLVQLRQELGQISLRDYRALHKASHFNACLYETMRLNPPVPSSGLRMAPKGGLNFQGVHIAEGTTICTPQHSMLRGVDERNYVDAEKWNPDRFNTKPELILNKQAFTPWSIGKMSCLGKNLSLMEIRVAAAQLIMEFDFEFAPGEDGTKMFTEAIDYFTTTPGPLNLVFKSRAAS